MLTPRLFLRKISLGALVLVLAGACNIDAGRDTKADSPDRDGVQATYRVTYDGNQNTLGTPPIDKRAYPAGETVTVLGKESLSLQDMYFAGWASSATNFQPGNTFAMPATNVSLQAIWSPVPVFTVTYDVNGGSGALTDSTAYAEGAVVTLADPGGLSNTGFLFTEWNLAPDGSGVAFASGATMIMGAADVVLYAIWNVRRINQAPLLMVNGGEDRETFEISPAQGQYFLTAFDVYDDDYAVSDFYLMTLDVTLDNAVNSGYALDTTTFTNSMADCQAGAEITPTHFHYTCTKPPIDVALDNIGIVASQAPSAVTETIYYRVTVSDNGIVGQCDLPYFSTELCPMSDTVLVIVNYQP